MKTDIWIERVIKSETLQYVYFHGIPIPESIFMISYDGF